ncbi:MAG: CBS domain-containing protein [Gemmatimonadota bacterium]
MNAKGLMTSSPTVIRRADTIGHAAKIMASSDVGMLPVVDEQDENRLVGVLTDRDIVIRCTAKNHDTKTCLVETHMTTESLTTVRSSADLSEIAQKMETSQVRRLPVIDADDHVIGVVSQADLARFVGPDNPELVEQVLERISTPA